MAKTEFDEILYDRRIVHRNIKDGVISPKDYERYLKSLEDDEDNAVVIETTSDSSGQTPRSSEDADEE